MSQIYHTVCRESPIDGVSRYYAQRVSSGTVSVEDLASEIASEAGQSEGTVLGLLYDLNNEICERLLAGYNVRLGNIGLLGLRFQGSGVEDEDEYSPELIDRVLLRLTPSSALKSALDVDSGNVSYTRIEE